MELLSILDEQVELLAKEGRPDLSRLFDSLESHSITPSEEVSSLRAEYGLERVSRRPVWVLDTCTNAITGTNSTGLLRYCRRPSRRRDWPRSWQAHAR
jgi:hypothetical protein